jgi:hypothetical protein
MKVRLISSIAVACCIAYPWQWLAAEEEIKYPSPDGRFALRITESKDDEYHPTVELIEEHSGTVLLTLHDGQKDSDLFDASEAALVWSADSKRVAYGFRANPPGAKVVERGVLVCFWERLGFRQGVFAGKFAIAADQVSQRKGGERETLWGRGESLEMVEIRRTGADQRRHDALAR